MQGRGWAAPGLPRGPLACFSGFELSHAPPDGLIRTLPLPSVLAFSPWRFIDHLLSACLRVTMDYALFTDAQKSGKNAGAQGGTAKNCQSGNSHLERPSVFLSTKPGEPSGK